MQEKFKINWNSPKKHATKILNLNFLPKIFYCTLFNVFPGEFNSTNVCIKIRSSKKYALFFIHPKTDYFI